MKDTFREVVDRMTTTCMLNKDNPDFYIGKLTIAQIEQLINNDDKKADIIWTAFERAFAEYNLLPDLQQQAILDLQN